MISTATGLDAALAEIGSGWRSQRAERQLRRHLERADFDALRDAGLLRAAAPAEAGGLWRCAAASVRPMCERYRRLASADPSVALVSSMHAAVMSYWLMTPGDAGGAWEEQRQGVFASAVAGDQWGTITSEPGSGGDISRTTALAHSSTDPAFIPGHPFRVSGDKHFGTGSGITDRMVTTAIADGEAAPTIFVLDVRDRPWDGSAGLTLLAAWDGMGMTATQSHAMRLADAPSVRLAWDGGLDTITAAAGPVIATLFTGVIVGVLDEAVGLARAQVRARAAGLRAYEQVEWARAEQDHWLAVQAYEGALRTIETGTATAALHAALRAKQAVAELAEVTMSRLTRVLGGGTFSSRSPFAHWFEDVRALGFLRPPWGLAFDQLFATSLDG